MAADLVERGPQTVTSSSTPRTVASSERANIEVHIQFNVRSKVNAVLLRAHRWPALRTPHEVASLLDASLECRSSVDLTLRVIKHARCSRSAPPLQ